MAARDTHTLELKTEKKAHNDYIRSVAFSPDGTKIVSGSDDKTIKVWDAGAFWAPKRFGPQIAPPWPKLTPVGLPGSYAGAKEREDERAQRLHPLRRLRARWQDDCVRIGRQDDQSLGCRCVLGLKSTKFRLS